MAPMLWMNREAGAARAETAQGSGMARRPCGHPPNGPPLPERARPRL